MQILIAQISLSQQLKIILEDNNYWQIGQFFLTI